MGNSTLRRFLTLTISAAVLVSLARDGTAQQPGTVAVTGSGTASAVPQYAVIKARVEGTGSSAEEAVSAYRKARGQIETAFAAADAPSAKLKFLGEKSAQQNSAAAGVVVPAGIGPGGAPAVPVVFSVSETVEMKVEFESDMERIQIAGKLGDVIDAAKNAGARFGHQSNNLAIAMGGKDQPIVEFALNDDTVTTTRGKAYAAALADARSRAATLAKLAGAKLGKVVSIEEKDEKSVDNPYMAMIWAAIETERGDGASARTSSGRNAAIEMRRDLRVVFELLQE